MKLLISFLLVTLLPLQWGTDLEAAKKSAKENHKLILLNFSGSDWCGPCILFRKEYLDSDAFSQMAPANLELVNADFPRKKKNIPAPEIVQKNNALAEIYNKEGNFPLTLLLDAEGKVLKTWHGKPAVSVDQWVAEVKAICDTKK